MAKRREEQGPTGAAGEQVYERRHVGRDGSIEIITERPEAAEAGPNNTETGKE